MQSARSANTGPGFVHQGDAITAYKWLINLDDVGDPGTALNQGTQACLPSTAGAGVGSTDPNFADTCQWPSIRNTSGKAPIIAQGDQSDLSSTVPLQGMAPGNYLISVLADGFKIDGQHFTVADGQVGTPVSVVMNPTPLPLSTLRIQVFNDTTCQWMRLTRSTPRRGWRASPLTCRTSSAPSGRTTTPTHCARSTCTPWRTALCPPMPSARTRQSPLTTPVRLSSTPPPSADV